MKKKILFIMPSMFIGGAERSLLGLLDSIDYTKYEVSLFLYRHEGEFLKYINSKVKILESMEAYATFDVPIKNLLFSNKVLFGVSRIASKVAMKFHVAISKETGGVWMAMQYISKYLQWLLPAIPGEYDVAISFLGVPDVLINKVNARKKMAWNHTDYSILCPNKRRDKEIYRKIDYLVSVSEPCTKQLLKVYPEFQDKAITIENILSVSLLQVQAEELVLDMKKDLNEYVLLSIGRFSDAKNFDNIPCICKEIVKKGISVKWYIIGYGGDEPLIRQRIKENNMENHVIILGKRENPYPYIKKCDVYIQPSRYEGKAVTVREAQILNKPVIITNFATSKSQLSDGHDGIIVPMDNKECAKGIVSLIQNKDLQQQLKNNMKQENYTNMNELEKLYKIWDS